MEYRRGPAGLDVTPLAGAWTLRARLGPEARLGLPDPPVRVAGNRLISRVISRPTRDITGLTVSNQVAKREALS